MPQRAADRHRRHRMPAKTNLLGVLVALASLVVARTAKAQTGSRAAEAEVAALVATYDSAWNSRDTVAVSRLLAPSYQYFTSRGGMSSRAETMSNLADTAYVLRYARRSELTVTPSAGVAIVSSRWQGGGTWRGEAFTDDQRCGQTWVHAGRAWQLLSEHCVQIAPRSPG